MYPNGIKFALTDNLLNGSFEIQFYYICNLKFGKNHRKVVFEKQKSHFLHCLKSVRIRSFSGTIFSAYGLNFQSNIQSKCGKIWTRKSPNTGTFHAVLDACEHFQISHLFHSIDYASK